MRSAISGQSVGPYLTFAKSDADNNKVTPSVPFMFQRPYLPFAWQQLAGMNIERIIQQNDISGFEPILDSLVHGDLETELAGNAPSWAVKVVCLQQFLAQYLICVNQALKDQVNELSDVVAQTSGAVSEIERLRNENKALREENEALKKRPAAVEPKQPREDPDKVKSLIDQIQKLKNELAAEKARRQCENLMLRFASLRPDLLSILPRCLECGKAFGDYDFLLKHYARKHPGIQPPPQFKKNSQGPAKNECCTCCKSCCTCECHGKHKIVEPLPPPPIIIEPRPKTPEPQRSPSPKAESDIFLDASPRLTVKDISDLIVRPDYYETPFDKNIKSAIKHQDEDIMYMIEKLTRALDQ